MTSTEAFLAAQMGRPYTHDVIVRYADGRMRVHSARSWRAAQNYIYQQAPKVGRDLIDRDTGTTVRVVSVAIVPSLFALPCLPDIHACDPHVQEVGRALRRQIQRLHHFAKAREAYCESRSSVAPVGKDAFEAAAAARHAWQCATDAYHAWAGTAPPRQTYSSIHADMLRQIMGDPR